MSKLYVANCTKFVQDFLYKLPEQQHINSYRVVIPMGGQAQVWNDCDRATLEFIVEQHRKYGLIAVSEIDRTKDFFGMCYQFDRPIDVMRIMEAIKHNEEATEIRNHQQRQIAAQALSNSVDKIMEGSESSLEGIEVEFVEQPKPNMPEPQRKEVIQVAKPGSRAAVRGAELAERASKQMR